MIRKRDIINEDKILTKVSDKEYSVNSKMLKEIGKSLSAKRVKIASQIRSLNDNELLMLASREYTLPITSTVNRLRKLSLKYDSLVRDR